MNKLLMLGHENNKSLETFFVTHVTYLLFENPYSVIKLKDMREDTSSI